MEGKFIQKVVSGSRRPCKKVPELAQRVSKGKEVKRKERMRKVVGWSTNEMDERVNSIEVKDTEEMVGWRNSNQKKWTYVERKLQRNSKRRSSRNTVWKTSEERLTEGGVENCRARFFVVRGIYPARKARHAGRFDGGEEMKQQL